MNIIIDITKKYTTDDGKEVVLLGEFDKMFYGRVATDTGWEAFECELSGIGTKTYMDDDEGDLQLVEVPETQAAHISLEYTLMAALRDDSISSNVKDYIGFLLALLGKEKGETK